MNNLKVLNLSNNIDDIQKNVLDLYEEDNLISEKVELLDILKKIESDDDIIITFIGQYSAGKSTIISALTGNRNIKIDANIATENATRYKWSDQITLVDSPGLYTEKTHHDIETKKAIESSDMLIYCITNELFDEITIEDYKKWAYELGYKDKIFLVINKMSRETGEYEELVTNYKESINKSLEPYSLKNMKYNFIDAQDYIEGKDLDFEELVKLSKFEEFILNLNKFVDEKGFLSKLDTPVKAIINSIDLVLSDSLENESDKNYINLFDRIYKRTDQAINEIKQESSYIVKQNLNPFISYGYDIAGSIGIDENSFNTMEIEQKLEEICININNEINELLESKNNLLEEEIEEVFNSELGKMYINNISKEFNIKDIDLTDKNNLNNFSKLMDFASKNKQGFEKFNFPINMKSSKVSGEALHKGVKAIGSKMGVKFKPWQAVNIAKNLGKTLGVISIGLGIWQVFSNVKESEKEENQEREISEAKIELRENFIDIAKELEYEYQEHIEEVLKEYKGILEKINLQKEEKLESIDKDSELNKKLEHEKETLKQIQENIFQNNLE